MFLIPEDVLHDLPRRLRRRRAGLGLTLEAVARRVDLSTSHLSRIEEGHRVPRLVTLARLASAYQLTLAELFAEEPRSAIAVSRAEPPRVHRGNPATRGPSGRTLRWALRSRGTATTMLRVIEGTLAPDAAPVTFAHPGEEWLFVLQGRLRLEVQREAVDLHEGDAAHFDALRPHRLLPMHHRPVRFLVASVPGLEGTLGSYL